MHVSMNSIISDPASEVDHMSRLNLLGVLAAVTDMMPPLWEVQHSSVNSEVLVIASQRAPSQSGSWGLLS